MGIATLYILASLYELRAGAILAVFNNPLTGEFTVGAGVKKTPLKSPTKPKKYSANGSPKKKKSKKRYFFPSLLTSK